MTQNDHARYWVYCKKDMNEKIILKHSEKKYSKWTSWTTREKQKERECSHKRVRWTRSHSTTRQLVVNVSHLTEAIVNSSDTSIAHKPKIKVMESFQFSLIETIPCIFEKPQTGSQSFNQHNDLETITNSKDGILEETKNEIAYA